MQTDENEKAETALPVYITGTERRLLRVRAAEKGLSMSKLIRVLIQRELESEEGDE